jgi:membrane protein
VATLVGSVFANRRLRSVWILLKETSRAWNRHEATRLGASLAFYTVLSLAPLVILTIAIVSLFIGVNEARQNVTQQFQELLGAAGAAAVRDTIIHAKSVKAGSIASILGVGTLLFGASQVFAELQNALNKIWEADESRTGGVVAIIRQRFLSFGLVLAIGLLLLVSLILSAALAALGTLMHGALPLPEWLLHAFDFLLSVAGTSALFALIFQYIPQADTDWRHSWIGGLMTAGLFSLGKSLIGIYLGKAGVGSAYGAAGSLVVVVAWVYYSSQIFFFGAEFTSTLTRRERKDRTEARLWPEGAQQVDRATPAVTHALRPGRRSEQRPRPHRRAPDPAR